MIGQLIIAATGMSWFDKTKDNLKKKITWNEFIFKEHLRTCLADMLTTMTKLKICMIDWVKLTMEVILINYVVQVVKVCLSSTVVLYWHVKLTRFVNFHSVMWGKHPRLYSSSSQPLLRGPQVLCKQFWSAPRRNWNPQYVMLKNEVWL